VIVRWGLDQLEPVLSELGIERPLLVASPRWDGLELPAAGGRWKEIPSDRIAVPPEADGILAVGGGSAIDTAKAASAASRLPLVSVPTTYSGAEWPSSFGVRTPERRIVAGGSGARLAGIVYDPDLTLGLPRETTVGTAMNALAHAAEALYVKGRNPDGDSHAREAATRIAAALPAVVDDGSAVGPRTTLLHGAAEAGQALASAGLGLAHAMAQSLGSRYGLPHGAMNALTLAPALRFNLPAAREEIESFGDAMGTDDPIGKVEALARLGNFGRLRDFGVPEDELGEVAEIAAARPGARANPRSASAAEIEEILRSIW
jgi:maleylacetate reductase